MSKVQLIYAGISQIVGGPELGLLILSNLSHTRQIAIVCDSRMEYELGLRTGDKPITERLLPEVLCNVNPLMTSEHYEILFNSIIDGQYKALLVNKDAHTCFGCCTSGTCSKAEYFYGRTSLQPAEC